MLEKDVGKILEATFSSSSDAHLKVLIYLFFSCYNLFHLY